MSSSGSDCAERTVVIGGGPAGLTAALELARADAISAHREVVVLERDAVVGGIARTVNHNGFRFDIGGHRFFTKNDRIRDLWHELLGDRLLRVPRLSRIYYNRRFFSYPLRPFDAARKLGPTETARIAASYLRAKAAPRTPEVSFEDWVVNRFGQRLFEIFFKAYTEKVWGLPTDEISADWAAQRIRGLSLRKAVVSAFRPPSSRSRVTSLIEEFEYPELGPGQMWEEAAARVIDAGGSVRFRQRVIRVRHDSRRIRAVEIETEDGVGEELEGTSFLSSMPMRDLVLALDPAPPAEIVAAAEALRYRDFVLVALAIDRDNLFPDNWIYVHAPDVGVGRIQNFKNWSAAMVPDPRYTCLGMEYFCDRDDAVWSASDRELIDRAGGELESLALGRREEIADGAVVRMEKTYPTYDHGYADRVATLRAWLDGLENLQLIGRNGMHRYNNQDHSMLTGILAARNLLGERHDLWQVNTDAEYLETKSGGEDADGGADGAAHPDADATGGG